MLEQTALLLDVGELLQRPGASSSLKIDAQVPGLAVGLGRVADEGRVRADLLLEVVVEGVLVSGTTQADLQLECSRCLVEFQEPVTVDIAEVYAYPDQPLDEVEVEEGLVITDDTIDLEPLVRDELLLAVPPNPLHDPACKGLCAVCGQDLNTADCGHVRQRVDIRWEPLRQLRDQIGGLEEIEPDRSN